MLVRGQRTGGKKTNRRCSQGERRKRSWEHHHVLGRSQAGDLSISVLPPQKKILRVGVRGDRGNSAEKGGKTLQQEGYPSQISRRKGVTFHGGEEEIF